MFSCENCEIFKNTYFEKYLQKTASELNQESTDYNLKQKQVQNKTLSSNRMDFSGIKQYKRASAKWNMANTVF